MVIAASDITKALLPMTASMFAFGGISPLFGLNQVLCHCHKHSVVLSSRQELQLILCNLEELLPFPSLRKQMFLNHIKFICEQIWL